MTNARRRTQPGDPPKGADVFWQVAKMEDPPLRIAVGTDAYAGIQNKIKQYSETVPKYEKLSSEFTPLETEADQKLISC